MICLIGCVALLAVAASVSDTKIKSRDVRRPLLPPGGCRNTFIDVGANAGDTVSVFLASKKGSSDGSFQKPPGVERWSWDPLSPRVSDYDYSRFAKVIGTIFQQSNTSSQDYCVLGIEGNSHWASHYMSLERAYAHRAEHIKMYSGVLVGIEEGALNTTCGEVDPARGHCQESFGEDNWWEDIQSSGGALKISHCTVAIRSIEHLLGEFHGRHAQTLILKLTGFGNPVFLPRLLESGIVAELSSEGLQVHVILEPTNLDSRSRAALQANAKTAKATFHASKVTNTEAFQPGGEVRDTVLLRWEKKWNGQ